MSLLLLLLFLQAPTPRRPCRLGPWDGCDASRWDETGPAGPCASSLSNGGLISTVSRKQEAIANQSASTTLGPMSSVFTSRSYAVSLYTAVLGVEERTKDTFFAVTNCILLFAFLRARHVLAQKCEKIVRQLWQFRAQKNQNTLLPFGLPVSLPIVK